MGTKVTAVTKTTKQNVRFEFGVDGPNGFRIRGQCINNDFIEFNYVTQIKANRCL